MSDIVIVGANLAGGRAAETLRGEGFDGSLTLIGAEVHRPYERPPLSKEYLRGDWTGPDKAFLRDELWYAENDVALMLGVWAASIDLEKRRVITTAGDVAFDQLLLCTGGRPRTLPVPGGNLPGVHTLRTIEDSTAIGNALRNGARLAVVGFGFIGAEVAASARTMGAEVTIIEVMPVPLERALGTDLGARLGQIHSDRGVTVRLGVGVDRIEGDGRVERLILTDGTTVEADLVVAGVGMEPATELAAKAGLTIDNGIVVDASSRTSHQSVFAAGDVAAHPNPFAGKHIRPEHWQNAQNHGAAAARSMLGAADPYVDLPWFWSDQYDLTVQMIGYPTRYDRLVMRADEGEALTAFYMDGERLVAAVGFNRAKDVRGVRALIQAGRSPSDEELADPAADLRALAKA